MIKMKNKKIIDICKRNRHIYLFNDSSENCQWVSDGNAIYLMTDMPHLNESYICKLYDITDSQADKITFRTNLNLPEDLNFNDTDATEKPTSPLMLNITVDSFTLIPLITEEGLMFLNSQYLTPFCDTNKNDIQIYTRKRASGETVFAIKVGLFLYAVVSPYNIISEEFVEKVKMLYKASETALFNNKSESGSSLNEKNSV